MSYPRLKIIAFAGLVICLNASIAYGTTSLDMFTRDAAMSAALRQQELTRTLAQAESLQGVEKKQPIPQKEYVESEDRLKETRQSLKDFLTQVKVHPYLTEKLSFDDNIFLLAEGGESDTVNYVKPGLKFIWGDLLASKDKNRIEIDAGLRNVTFFHHSNLNRNLPEMSLAAQFGRGKNKLSFSQKFKKDYSVASNINIGTAGLADYTSQKTKVDYEYGQGHFGFGLGYDRDEKTYAGQYKKGSSTDEQVGGMTVFIQPSEKTRFFVEGDYGGVSYFKFGTPANDSTYVKGFAGIKGKITEKTSGVIKLGHQSREFKNKGLDPLGDFAAEIDLENKFSPRTSFLFKAARGSLTDTFANDGTTLETDFYLGLRHAFTPKLGLNMGYRYAMDRYYISGKFMETFYGMVELRYNFRKWLNMGLGYKYEDRNSKKYSSSGEYLDNIFSIDAGVIF